MTEEEFHGLFCSQEEWLDRVNKHYILLDGEPVAVPLLEWGKWFEKTEHRVIGQEDVLAESGSRYWVSTVFLGLDHGFPGGEPLIFETMIFRWHEPLVIGMVGGKEWKSDREEVYMRRYSTLRQAELGHVEALARAEIDSFDDDD